MKKIFRILFLAIAYILPTASIAEDTYDPETGIVHMPIVSVGTENFEVDMLHQGDLVFKVISVVNSTTKTLADTYDASSGILHISSVIVGADNLEVEMAHQGNLVFKVTKVAPIATSDFKFTTEYLNGKTLYNVYTDYDDEDNDGSNRDLVAATFKFTDSELEGRPGIDDQSTEKRLFSYIITSNGYLQFEDSVVSVLEATSDRLKLCWRYTDEAVGNEACSKDNKDNHEYFYFDKSKAQAVISATEINSLFSLVVGKTLYYVHTYNSGVNEVYSIEFKTNGELIIEFQHGSEVFNYIIDGNKIDESGAEHQLIEETEKYIKLVDLGNLYFTRADAEQGTIDGI